MVPTLYDGDRLLVGYGLRVRPGDLVVASLRDHPDLLVVKRAVAARDGGWALASDNEFVPDPSALGDVVARVLLRYRPLLRRSFLRRPRP
jgi:phage repressor protein C with HTH and peptisase S24 domain